MGRYDYWSRYVPVAERRAKAKKQMDKLLKKGVKVQPVQPSGRTIASSFWGKGWCDHMESFSDYSNRLPRGRTYVRNGSVCHLQINSGEISALVSGSSLYKVSISIKPLPPKRWETVKHSCSGKIGSLIDLLRGKLDHGVMEVVTDRNEGLFPLPGEMTFDCDCPDWAGMCKHVAAVLYGVGARLDHAPEMLFLLRGVNHQELVDVTAAIGEVAKTGTSRRRIAATGIADVFGVELAETADDDPVAVPLRPMDKSEPQKRRAEPPKPRSAIAEEKVAVAKKTAVKKGAMSNKPVKKPQPFPDPLTGDAIRSWRKAIGETQAKFAARVKVTGSTVSQWEKRGKAEVGMFSGTLAMLRKEWKKTEQEAKRTGSPW